VQNFAPTRPVTKAAPHDRGLADPGGTGDKHRAAVAALGFLELARNCGELFISSDEWLLHG
jgi:hypothetical protein